MSKARQQRCPGCDKPVSVKMNGQIRDHVNWKDQYRLTPLCPGSGQQVADDFTPINGN